jgi:transcriptional regulator with PAS, ATPase and Fis domain
MQKMDRVAPTDFSVLLVGKTGVGKEKLARYIHEQSPRKDKPYIAINCGGKDANFIEDELFGHEKGAFTGAVKVRTGKFAEAKGGTIFLDELDKMPHELQAKLLRVLNERTYYRIGSDKEAKTDVRIIAAVNTLVKKEPGNGKAQKQNVLIPDLYYRLARYPVKVPSLRERPEDIAPLAGYFVENVAAELGFSTPPALPEDALEILKTRRWAGNVRELENVIAAAVLDAGNGGTITAESLQKQERKSALAFKGGSNVRVLDILTRHNTVSQSQIAEGLGMSRNRVNQFLNEYETPAHRPDKTARCLAYVYRRDGEEGARLFLEALLKDVIEQDHPPQVRRIG